MKKNLTYGVLLATVFSFSLSCSSISLKIKDTRPIIEPIKVATQATLPAIQTILWHWLLAGLDYLNEVRRQFSRRQFDDLALLKAIKDNAARLWQLHYPGKKIILLKDWRE